MRVIFFRYVQIIAMLVLGAIIGASLMNFQTGKRIDELHHVKDELTNELHDKNIRLQELEKSLEKVEGIKYTVKSLSIHVTLEKDDEFVQLELEKKIKELLLEIVGRELDDLDPLTIPAIVNKRKVLVEDDEYSLDVVNTLISEEVVMYLKAKRLATATIASPININ